MMFGLVALGKNFEKVSAETFAKEVLPQVFENKKVFLTVGEDRIEFAAKPGKKMPKLNGWQKQWQTLLFRVRKVIYPTQTKFTKEYGDFTWISKKSDRVWAANEQGMFYFQKASGKEMYQYTEVEKVIEGEDKDTIVGKTTTNIDWFRMPQQIREVMDQKKD
jgi:hypothetical protein